MSTPDRAEALADLERAAAVPGWLAEQVEADAAADRFSLWGRSTVVDENTGSPVISEALFAELHRMAGLDAVWPIGNAGLLHVYGYLLSTVDTPYGRKRDRWLGGGVARAFGLPDDAFAPWFVAPWFVASAARDSTPLERVVTVAMPYVEDPAGGDATLMWVDERGPGPATDTHDTFARTVIVQARSGATALLYAVGTGGSLLLVTLFPLAWSASDRDGAAWLAAIEAGVPRLRYNAIDGRNVASAQLVDRRVSRREG
ncbi:hypothetical protein ABIE21_001693 [Conyzicola nivalis]|uniref:Amino acid deaminase n=1 Tax=Conyzicola nivalis TaxID=1477021 RepID=A0ABV2QMD0_9MICO